MQNIELNRLPLQAQTELLDFYEFLLQKYTKTQPKNNQFEQFLSTPIEVEQLQNWTREELHER
jgi:signal-transduction protein with cAMP-binding, CBS, and nucleotidyltransferase domain